jgi:outer membrane receptor protein involved in Fe transport
VPPLRRPAFALFLGLNTLPAAEATAPAPLALPTLVVTATRAPQDPSTLPLATEVFTAKTLRTSPALTLDDTLRRSAAFSLFRRTGSLTANPTAQGVSLRGIGPSGASRALVLLDGIPVNDPFGGWVAWTKLPVATLDRVEIVRGGGSTAWGGASLGGVVHLLSAPLLSDNITHSVTSPPPSSTGSLSATLGDFRTRAAEASATFATASGRDAFRVDAAAFATDGVRLVRNPGLIDVPADSEHQRGGLTWARRIDETTTLTAAARAWTEERGNGTPYQRNASEELAASVTLAGAPSASPVSAWSVTLHGQDQDYRSTFSAVNAARTAETPASDQYAVPATAAGLSAQLTFGDAADLAAGFGSVTTAGLDARRVDGETREYFFYNGSAFTRERRAGGAQTVAGLFATHARPLAPDLTLTAGARLDATRHADGFRRETTRATGAPLLDETYADRDDLAFSPSLGLAWRATESVTARAAAYSAYRTPTLNELYRPFRIGTITTNANPALEPETLLGGEFGFAYAAPFGRRGLSATVFQNDLSDAVANVTINATTRQRRNLDATRVRGLELGAFWTPAAAPALRLDADYLLTDARVRSGGLGAADLDGKRLAQVPRHTVSAGATWQAARALSLDLRARWFSAQYEDDLNTLPLASAARLDLSARYSITPRLSLTVAVENLFDTEIETARTSAGLVSIAPPRLARAELTYAW